MRDMRTSFGLVARALSGWHVPRGWKLPRCNPIAATQKVPSRVCDLTCIVGSSTRLSSSSKTTKNFSELCVGLSSIRRSARSPQSTSIRAHYSNIDSEKPRRRELERPVLSPTTLCRHWLKRFRNRVRLVYSVGCEPKDAHELYSRHSFGTFSMKRRDLQHGDNFAPTSTSTTTTRMPVQGCQKRSLPPSTINRGESRL